MLPPRALRCSHLRNQHPGHLLPATHERRTRLVSGVGRRGVVSVIRDLGLKERVSGQAPMFSGEIDADVEHYLTTSEQIESAMGCDAVLAQDGSVRVAGGVLVQCLPDDRANKEMVSEMWRRLRLDAVYDTLDKDPAAIDSAGVLARAVLGEFAAHLDVLDTREVRFPLRVQPGARGGRDRAHVGRGHRRHDQRGRWRRDNL